MHMKTTIVKEKTTLESIARSISKLATKEEISKLATKSELGIAISKLATKEEISQLATKEEISKLVTKEDLENEINDFALVVKRSFDKVDKKFDTVFERLDDLEQKSATKTDLYETETRLAYRISKIEDTVDKIYAYVGKSEIRTAYIEDILYNDHGPRIRTLEKQFIKN